jgi:hypothetical protein
MTWWSEKAGNLQQGVIAGEAGHTNEFYDDEVRRAVVHGRQDIVLLVGHLDAVNIQLRTIKVLLAFIAVLLLVIVIR